MHLKAKTGNEGFVGKEGDASVDKWGGGLGGGCLGRWRGAGSWAAEHSWSTGRQRGSSEESSLAGEISDCSMIVHFMLKVHLCLEGKAAVLTGRGSLRVNINWKLRTIENMKELRKKSMDRALRVMCSECAHKRNLTPGILLLDGQCPKAIFSAAICSGLRKVLVVQSHIEVV